ncbi:MAG: hypothetical protein ABI880_10770 [Acidobacteriota bacterium]
MSPIAPTAPARAAGPIRVMRIVDGWSGAPVPDVRVTVNQASYMAAADGSVTVSMGCAIAAFSANGFLERRVRCLNETTKDGAAPLTLWPAASTEEAPATSAAAFPGDRLGGAPVPFYLSTEVTARADAVALWTDATVRAKGRGLRAHTRGSRGPRVAGFCWDPGRGYFVNGITVRPELIAGPTVALRAVLSSSGLRPHPMAGIMNATRPEAEISLFERKSLHMVGLRGHIAWPDNELCQGCY